MENESTGRNASLSKKISDEIDRARRERSKELQLLGKGLYEIPEQVFELTDVEFLNFANNRIHHIPEKLKKLPNLKSVNLINNPIEFIPDLPGLIIDGTIYSSCRNQISPENVCNLILDIDAHLDGLNFFVNELSRMNFLRNLFIGKRFRFSDKDTVPKTAILEMIDSIADLEYLEGLELRGFKLIALPEGIQRFTNLKRLCLTELEMENIPPWIGQLHLEEFSAINNKLTELPPSFSQLINLRSLRLSQNPLFAKIPQQIFELSSLELLNLNQCNISAIPPDILRLQDLKEFYFEGNYIESPPNEVAAKGLNAIRDYWRQRTETGVDYLCEAKLIILGEAGAGKTSLARKIEDPNYKLVSSEKSTEGIDVIRYQFPTVIRPKENGKELALNRSFQVNIWDFGGQEIYHATHQFFLTRRSVYVLVCDDRKEDTDFSYWLHVIELLSDASPLLIVQNEKQDRTRDINMSNLRARFSNLRGSCQTNLETNRGLDDVNRSIRKELENLSHVGVGLPSTWKRVRVELEKDTRDYINLEEYLTICGKHGFTRREDKLQLSGYLHDLGICLHFQDDPLLKNVIVLKPSWGTEAVYRVLDDSTVISARGRFRKKQLRDIWSEQKYVGMQDELLRLMMKFQLCYALENEREYIAPQLLSSDQPYYQWEPDGNLVVRYEYGFMPKGLLTRFIVSMHHLIADDRLVWKTGVILEKENSRAEVIEEYVQRRIRVRVCGSDPHGLFAILDDQLERLHASFPRLQYERFLPCPCRECKNKAEPYSFPLEKLVKMAVKRLEIQCHDSGEMVDAENLVQEILPGALRREEIMNDSSLSCMLKNTVHVSPAVPEVFVSYAWNDKSNALVDKLHQSLRLHGIRLIRDKEEIRYRDSIREFMRCLGKGKCIIVIISTKYLKSENCMFELLQISRDNVWRERIFPIVLADADIYKATGRVKYVQYWENEIHKLNRALKVVRGDHLANLQADLTLYADIRRLFDGITETLRDMNALTPGMHEGTGFEQLIRQIHKQMTE